MYGHIVNTINMYGHIVNTINMYGHIVNTINMYGHIVNTINMYGHNVNTINMYGHIVNTINMYGCCYDSNGQFTCRGLANGVGGDSQSYTFIVDNIKVCSFNCKGIKSSTGEILELCASYDIILIQETWLFDFDFSSLNNIHHEFYGRGESAIKSEDGVLIGRPHGGIAILWRKNWSKYCKIHRYDDRSVCLFLGV